jgi:hypothetical protein
MAMPLAASVALDEAGSHASPSGQTAADPPSLMYDAAVTIEEYMYWAAISREEEVALLKVKGPVSKLLGMGHSTSNDRDARHDVSAIELKDTKVQSTSAPVVSKNEWDQAQRAARTAGWAAVFYLITTDVLGPYTVPWALAQMGFGPGITLYAVFGALAGYTGWQVSLAS